MDIYRSLYGSIMNHFCLPIHAGANNMLLDADLIWYLNKWTQWLHSQTFVKTSHRAQKVDLQSKNSSVPLCRSVQSPSETSGCSLAEVQSSCWSSFSAATSFSMSWRSNVAGRLLVELQGPATEITSRVYFIYVFSSSMDIPVYERILHLNQGKSSQSLPSTCTKSVHQSHKRFIAKPSSLSIIKEGSQHIHLGSME